MIGIIIGLLFSVFDGEFGKGVDFWVFNIKLGCY